MMRSTFWEALHIPTWIIVIVVLLCHTVTAHAGPLEDCDQTRDVERRISGCTDIIRQFPRAATAFFNRGAAYLSKGDLDRTIADNTAVIEIDPAYASAYYHRGLAFERTGHYDHAIADLSKALEINIRYGEALDARARLYLKTGQSALALRDADRAVSLDPFELKFLETRARVYEALGRTQDAINEYRRLLSGNPSMQSAIDGLRRLRAPPSPVSRAAAADKAPRSAGPQTYAVQPRYAREEIECERAQHEDQTGQFAGYPCWAREALSRRGRR